MTIYKLVSCQFKWFGLQGRVENIIQHVTRLRVVESIFSLTRTQFERKIFFLIYRQLFCTIDEWFGLTMEDIRRIEDETKAVLAAVSSACEHGRAHIALTANQRGGEEGPLGC